MRLHERSRQAVLQVALGLLPDDTAAAPVVLIFMVDC